MSKENICHVDMTSFHEEIGSGTYPFENDCYWLFTSKLCPFSQRTEIALARSGLSSVIGLTIAGPIQTEKGWNLSEYHLAKNSKKPPFSRLMRIPDIYELAQPGYCGTMSIPVLFDTKTQTIVNNESSEIIRMFNRLRSSHSVEPSFNPKEQHNDINDMCDFLANELISPIYKAGFAKDQASYIAAAERVFKALNVLENTLSTKQKFLIKDDVTAADIHAFPHLARFDAVFHSLYNLNKFLIRDFSNISEYLERLSNELGFTSTLDIDATKRGYFQSWNQPNKNKLVPIGPIVSSRTGVALS